MHGIASLPDLLGHRRPEIREPAADAAIDLSHQGQALDSAGSRVHERPSRREAHDYAVEQPLHQLPQHGRESRINHENEGGIFRHGSGRIGNLLRGMSRPRWRTHPRQPQSAAPVCPASELDQDRFHHREPRESRPQKVQSGVRTMSRRLHPYRSSRYEVCDRGHSIPAGR